jgi:hypothetical protein
MDIIKKRYRSIYAKTLSVCITVDGEVKNCEFFGGTSHPKKVNGKYSTVCPKTQAALESHPWHGKMFKLDGQEVIGKALPQPIPKPAEPTEQEEPSATEAEVYLSPATNAQEAKKELNAKFGVPWSQLKNSRQVKKLAAEKGIQYPNWVVQ